MGLLALPAIADNWTGQGAAGLVIVSGNSDSQLINGSLEAAKKQFLFVHRVNLAFTTAESNGEDSAESYLIAYNNKYDFSQRQFWFGDIRYLDDKFDSFHRIITVSTGYGYRLFDDKTRRWSVAIGPGYRDTKLQDTGEDSSSGALIGESDLSYQLTSTTKLLDELRFEAAEDNTAIQNIAGISLTINKSLSLKLTYDVRYNSDPAPEKTSTDKTTSVNLVYKI